MYNKTRTESSIVAYQAFYNKYRPQNFDEVVGQKAVVTTLKNAIAEDKISHAYLFCGPRGTGKTTMARLFAKALNCEEGLGHQCQDCQSCSLIMKGEHPDVFELDAASNSSVDDIRRIVDTVSYQPIMGRYKVYIIDEVHSISKDAFNALLKTLEEPPSFVIFILATTEPQQILPTILSRVQRFDFSKVSENDLIFNMERVLKTEGIEYEKDALKLITSLSDGGVRDSLSLLEKSVSYCGRKVTSDGISDLLGLLSTDEELELIRLLSAKNVNEALTYVKARYERGADIRRLHLDLIAIYKDYLIYQATRNPALLSKLDEAKVQKVHLSPNKAKADIDELITSFRQYKLSEDIFADFELLLLKLTSNLKVVKEKDEESGKKTLPTEETLQTKPIAVEPSKTNHIFAPEPEKEKPDEEEKILCDKEELLNLMFLAMSQNTKELRKSISTKWANLESLFATEFSFLARALSSSRLRLVYNDILLVSCPVLLDQVKLSQKNQQQNLIKITEQIFGSPYKVLTCTDADFADCTGEIRRGIKKEPHPCNIDFGVTEVGGSTAFLNDLFGGES